MTKAMDLEQNGRMDWFFNEWVYGTEVPRYSFSYQLLPAGERRVKVRMTITQADVDARFAMLLPVYADFGKGMIHMAQLPIVGNTTKGFDVVVPAAPKKVAFNAYKEILER
jgi:hypothetical protein